MDPVTAFGLAAGILQVVDISFKALSKCQEIYRDGSLAENRSTEEITKLLSDTTNRLKISVQDAPSANSQDYTDIKDISEKCSKTAEDLLAELAKARLELGGGRRQAIVKGIRALRRKKFVADSQEKLETYQRVLNTRILVRLNAHSIQQAKNFRNLDQNIKNLATALYQGRNTVEQLLAFQSLEIQEHVDRRLNEHAQIDQESKTQAQFKQSLFFSEIYARQDSIHTAHEGTCRWIFADSGRNGEVQSHPWPSLAAWFEHGDEPYWLSGKAGSGKSTLMKYITNEFRAHVQREDASSPEIIAASFFFWNPGSELQKNLVGFLRSLLYQLADQRPDLIPIMINGQADPMGLPNTSHQPTLYAWTEHRLSLALRQVLNHIPSSIALYFFIDGLDEFVGDEDELIYLVRLMDQTQRVKVCVSSRPEQVFRLGFARSPQIRLQDLNLPDLKKAAEERLHPVLVRYFPENEKDIAFLIESTVNKAQGVFLWLELMTKSLRTGAYSADTMQELQEKLNQTPDSLEGMYQHMLNNLDKSYRSEAFRYFSLLIRSEEWSLWSKPLNLLELVFTESELWDRVRKFKLEYFTSPEFMHHCLRVETRILTRCGGLVEIQERPIPFVEGVQGYVHSPEDGSLDDPDHRDHEDVLLDVPANSDEQSPSRHLRSVEFIHRTVAEFLRSRHEAFFHGPSEVSAAAFALAQGKLGVMNLIPALVSPSITGRMVVTFFDFMHDVMNTLMVVQTTDQALENGIITTVNQMYQDIESIDVALNGPGVSWPKRYQTQYKLKRAYAFPVGPNIRKLPFNDSSGFAAFFGCPSHVLHSTILHDASQEQIDCLLTCTLTGLKLVFDVATQYHRIRASLFIIRELLSRGAGSTSYIEPEGWADNMAPFSPWVAFFIFLARVLYFEPTAPVSHVNEILEEVVTSFLSHGADANSRILSTSRDIIWDFDDFIEVKIAMEETPLSLLEESRISNRDSLGEVLRSYGGLSRRRCHFIRFFGDTHVTGMSEPISKDEWYRLSKRQSDRLCELQQSYPKDHDFAHNAPSMDPELERYIRDIMQSLTDSAIAKRPIAEPRSNWDEVESLKTDEDIAKSEIEEDGFTDSDEDSFKSVE